MLVKSRDFGHLVYNQQNHIIFYWHFYAEWKTKISPKMFVYSQDDQSFYKCLNNMVVLLPKFMIMIQGWCELKNS